MPKNISHESDWKLFSTKYCEWKERYAAAKLEEYKALLAKSDNATDTFFELRDHINNDLHSPIFRLPGRFSRNNMYMNILSLLNNGIITLDDLSDFSDEIKEMAKLSTRSQF